MAKLGEDPNITDAEALELEAEAERRPSAFYLLMENAGPEGALDALQAAEDTAPRPRQVRPKDATQLAEEHARRVRRAFSETWHFLQGNDSARQLLSKLEKEALRAFGPLGAAEDSPMALLWMLHWDGDGLETKFGAPPANEIAVGGLSPTFRKVAHQLARTMGLVSESREVDGPNGADENKVVAFRPPRKYGAKGDHDVWVAPPSVAEVLSRE